MNNFQYETDDDFQRPNPTLEDVMEALKKNVDAVPDETIIYGLSDLTSDQIDSLRPTWNALNTAYRQILLEILVDEMESNYELDYQAIGVLSLDDLDPRIRQTGIELLAESEDLDILDRMVQIVNHDKSNNVRAEALKSIGNFLLLGELGDIDEEETKVACKLANSLYKNEQEDIMVRARALEAVAYCSIKQINQYITDAYESADDILRVSAIVAMGRTADKQRWEDTVLEELDLSEGEMQLEAARAAGELQIPDAIPLLARLLQEDNPELIDVCVWSLGEIGGKEAIRLLELLAEVADENEDDDLLERIEDAIGSANMALNGLFNVDLDD